MSFLNRIKLILIHETEFSMMAKLKDFQKIAVFLTEELALHKNIFFVIPPKFQLKL